MVDKVSVKEYVGKIIGTEYIIPTICVWSRVEDIDYNKLPEKFVLKCNHDAKSVVICRNRGSFDCERTKIALKNHLMSSGYWYGREWPYRNVKPQILAEILLETNHEETLTDYKILCFNGQAKLCEIHQGRFSSCHTQDIYDCSQSNWVKTKIAQGPMSGKEIEAPVFLNDMIQKSEILAAGFRHVRIDWYYTHRLFFGEITFYDGSGFVRFDRHEDDLLLGSWIKLNGIRNAKH
jgi:hypothetical protein